MNEDLPIYYVYMFIDPRTNTPIYVGKGKHKRYEQHFETKSLWDNTLFHNYLRKMIRDKVSPIIEFVEEGLTSEEALRLEVIIISKYGRLKTNTGPLLNLTDGGEGTSGVIMSKETRKKMSKSKIGTTLSEETIKKIIANSPSKMSIEDTERKTKMMQERYGHQICSYNLKTGKLIKVYPSLKSVRKNGLSYTRIKDVCLGYNKHYNYRGWRYYYEQDWDENGNYKRKGLYLASD